MLKNIINYSTFFVSRPLVVLFVKLDLGGIETYYAKISHQLITERKLLVCALKPSRHQGLLASFHPSVKVITLIELILYICANRRRGIDVIATGRNVALLAGLMQLMSPSVRVRLGVYSQYELSERSKGLLKFAYTWIFRKLGPDRTFFCTQGLKEKQASLYAGYAKSQVIPLAVSSPPFVKTYASSTMVVRILTIGRFVDFKLYLWALPSLVEELSSMGIEAELDIYGYGPLEANLRNYVQQSTVAGKIHVRGKINPQDIDQVLLETDLFIGSGSMLLEAASRGVPSIVCIDSYREPNSPGYLHELPLNLTSEERSGTRMVKFSQLVQRYTNMISRERNSFFRDSYEYCKYYEAECVSSSLLRLFSTV